MKMEREDVRRGRWKGFRKEDEKGKPLWKDEREREREKEREIEDVRKWEKENRGWEKGKGIYEIAWRTKAGIRTGEWGKSVQEREKRRLEGERWEKGSDQ
jgi:hypothetical protein